MKRRDGSGQIYEKWGAYYRRWRTADGRRLNRRIGPKRTPGESDGLTRAQAEQAFRRIQAEEAARRPVDPVVEIVTVDQAADRLRQRIAIEGARLSYRQNCESMQRVHISPAMGKKKVAVVTTREWSAPRRVRSQGVPAWTAARHAERVAELVRRRVGAAGRKDTHIHNGSTLRLLRASRGGRQNTWTRGEQGSEPPPPGSPSNRCLRSLREFVGAEVRAAA
jgi:hypothetical protein